MGRSRSFASTAADLLPLRAANALFRLGFPTAPARKALTNRPTTVTPRIIMQKARRQAIALTGHSPPTACRRMVSDSFHSPRPGFFSSFGRPTEFAIGHQGVFSLTGWSPLLQSGFHVPRPTQVPSGRRSAFVYGAVTLFGLPFQYSSTSRPFSDSHVEGPTTPRRKPPRFGLFPVRSPLLRESRFLSFPPATKMFQFAGFAATRLWIQRGLIRESPDQRSFDSFPGLFAVFHALHRLLMPRHPPCALSSLAT